jgi:alkylated DNA repair dioxygenase AlkB
MTLNTYSMGAAEVPGFPYHVDLPANGPITMIATLRRGATLELRHKDAAAGTTPERIILQPGSLVVLSGEARYEWEHRILSSPGSGGEEGISRVSIVFGCQ